MSKSTRPNKRHKPTHQKPASRSNGRGPGRTLKAKSRQSTTPRQPQQSDYDSKRKLWDRKQAELEARWVAAQARQTSDAAARRRTLKRACGMAGMATLALLLLTLALYFRPGGFGLVGL